MSKPLAALEMLHCSTVPSELLQFGTYLISEQLLNVPLNQMSILELIDNSCRYNAYHESSPNNPKRTATSLPLSIS